MVYSIEIPSGQTLRFNEDELKGIEFISKILDFRKKNIQKH